EGVDGHTGFADLPKGFSLTTRSELLAKLSPPESSWKLGKGNVPVTTPDVMRDTWTVDGRSVSAEYRHGAVQHYYVERADQPVDLSTYPLHFETTPTDAPKDADLVGMALLVGWAATRHGLPPKHADSPLGAQLLANK